MGDLMTEEWGRNVLTSDKSGIHCFLKVSLDDKTLNTSRFLLHSYDKCIALLLFFNPSHVVKDIRAWKEEGAA